MKVLQICSQPPFPDNNGASKAFLSLANGLLSIGIDLKILSFASPASQPVFNESSNSFYEKTAYSYVNIENRVKSIDAFFNLFSKKSYNISRFVTKEFKDRLKQILNENKFDIIQFETLFTTPYLETAREFSDAKMVYRSHNIEHLIWERRAKITKNPFKKPYLNFLAKRLKAFETQVVNDFDAVVSITEIDDKIQKEYLNPGIKTISIPVGFDMAEQNYPQPKDLSLFFIGALDWAPNEQGLNWFLNNVWEDIFKKNPKIKFYIAGRNIPAYFQKWADKNVEICGEVPSSSEFIQQHSIMLVPLFFGSGIRVKIVEAMSFGKVVISTKIGAEGIFSKDSEQILLANSKEEFIEKISNCVANPDLVKNISENAFNFAKENYENRNLVKKLVAFYNSL